MTDSRPAVQYKDLYFRLILSLAAAHIIVMFGERHSLSELLLMPEYYISVAASFLIAFTLVSTVRWVTLKLDRRYDWMDEPLQRTGMQILLVVIGPGLLAFLLAAIYFKIQGLNILDTVYLRLDFPVILLMLVMLNLYYVAYYFYQHAKNAKVFTSSKAHADQQGKETFIVSAGTKNIPLTVEDVSYFFRAHDVNYLRTVDGKDYMISQSLDEVQQQVDTRQFFRANRQILVTFKACRHFESLPYGKLQLFVQPEYKGSIIISQKRAKEFKEWMER